MCTKIKKNNRSVYITAKQRLPIFVFYRKRERMEHQIEITEDGSHTLYVPELDEHYHSTHGAIQESKWVYIDAGLKQCAKSAVNILEIGFGTGLNAFLSLIEAENQSISIHYTSLERYPLTMADVEKLNYVAQINPSMKDFFLKLHQSPWNESYAISPHFVLEKRQSDASNPMNFPSDRLFDVVFFDAFAPEKQPEMWTPKIFAKIYNLCNNNAIFSTYCAKGNVRRTLQSVGFTIERLPGPPGKREILRGKKP